MIQIASIPGTYNWLLSLWPVLLVILIDIFILFLMIRLARLTDLVHRNYGAKEIFRALKEIALIQDPEDRILLYC